MKRIVITGLLMAFFSFVAVPAQGQILKNLGKMVRDKAVEKVEQRVEQGIDNAIDGALDKAEEGIRNTGREDGGEAPAEEPQQPQPQQPQPQPEPQAPAVPAVEGWTCPECGATGNTGKFCAECGAKKPEAGVLVTPSKKPAETSYAKSDFVPGDEIIFEDDFADEQLGEFPSKWDLISGVSEVVKFDGKMTFDFQDLETRVAPLMKNPCNYLTDEFTVECDFYAGDNSTIEEGLYSRSSYRLEFYTEDGSGVCEFDWHTADSKTVSCYYTSTSDRRINSDAEIGAYLNDGEWNHLSISFNKRAFKAYINGTRVVNIPNMKAPDYLELASRIWGDHGVNFITNVRIAKGAVPLYDRLATDGKIITYAITFETGKADLKPESFVEINRIAKLMQDNPNISFEVQGHCDATGSDKVNDPLSQKRAEAIVDALVDLGIARTRLAAVGKGSHSPIADNSTDEGRAKNRRVEFVKKSSAGNLL